MKNTRREFLSGIGKVAGGAMLGYITLPVLTGSTTILAGCEPTSVPLEPEVASQAINANGQITVSIAALSQGNPAIVIPNFIAPDGYPVIVTLTPDGLYHAFSMRCTHQACSVDSQLTQGDIHCSCHGSEFSLEGQVVQGPATLPLTSYTIVPNPPVGGVANIQIIPK